MSKLNEILEKWKKRKDRVEITPKCHSGDAFPYKDALLQDWDEEMLYLQFVDSGKEWVVNRREIAIIVATPRMEIEA